MPPKTVPTAGHSGTPHPHDGPVHHPVPPKTVPETGRVDVQQTHGAPTHSGAVSHPPVLQPVSTEFSVTDHYVWDLKDADTLQNGYDLPKGSYSTVQYGVKVDADDLLRQKKDWFLLLDEDGQPYEAIHRNALKEMMEFSRHEARALGLKGFDDFYIKNDTYANAQTDFTGIHSSTSYRYDLSLGLA